MIKIRRILFAPALATGLLLAPITTTAATAGEGTDCRTWVSNSGRTGNVSCTSPFSGVRQHRVVVTCVNSGGHTFTIRGEWRYMNKTSSATCSTTGTAGVANVDWERRMKG